MKYFDTVLGRLSRVTSGQKFIPEVDGLRFIAITTVVLFHLRTHVLRVFDIDERAYRGDAFFDMLSNGGLGVNLFFTISGFILALPFARQYLMKGDRVNLKSYYVRRLTRLEPPYIIVMTAFFILQLLATGTGVKEMLPHYLASLGYVHFFVFGTWSTINPVAWSLETEVQFYLVAPLIAGIFLLRHSMLRTAVLLVAIIIYSLGANIFFDELVSFNLYKSIAFYLPYFFLGFVLAPFYLAHGQNVRKSWMWDVAGILTLLIMYRYYEFRVWYWDLILLGCIVFVFGAVFFGRVVNYCFTNKIVTVVGGMCYSIYLIHYVFIYVIMLIFAPLLSGVNGFYTLFLFSSLFVLPALLVCSSLIFYLIEKPFMYNKWYVNLRGAFDKR